MDRYRNVAEWADAIEAQLKKMAREERADRYIRKIESGLTGRSPRRGLQAYYEAARVLHRLERGASIEEAVEAPVRDDLESLTTYEYGLKENVTEVKPQMIHDVVRKSLERG